MHQLWKLLKEIVTQSIEDRLTAEAARAAYYFFLSLFPAILAIFALTGIFGGDAAFEWIMGRLRVALPGDAEVYLERFVREVTGQTRPGILSFSILFTFWSASNVFVAVTDGLNRMYDIEEARPWWMQRLVALAAVLAGSVLLIGSTVVVLAGPELFDLVGVGVAWDWLRWPVVVVLLVALLWLAYLVLPDRGVRGATVPTLIGAAVGTGLWILATWGFRVYVSNFSSYDQTYGFVGGVIVLLLWLYLTALVVLFGGEVAATVEQWWDDEWEVGEAPPEERSTNGTEGGDAG